MPTNIIGGRDSLRNIAKNAAANGRGAYSRLDFTSLADIGSMADYLADLDGVTIGTAFVDALDPASDTGDNAKARGTLRTRLQTNVRRNFVATHGDKSDCRCYFADVPADNADGFARGYVVERTK